MDGLKSLEEARAYFEKDRFATENGIVIEEVSPASAVCTMEITARHRNAEGGVMGGAIFTLVDLAYAAAANSPPTWKKLRRTLSNVSTRKRVS